MCGRLERGGDRAHAIVFRVDTRFRSHRRNELTIGDANQSSDERHMHVGKVASRCVLRLKVSYLQIEHVIARDARLLRRDTAEYLLIFERVDDEILDDFE